MSGGATFRQFLNRETISDASSHNRALTKFKFIVTQTVSKNKIFWLTSKALVLICKESGRMFFNITTLKL